MFLIFPDFESSLSKNELGVDAHKLCKNVYESQQPQMPGTTPMVLGGKVCFLWNVVTQNVALHSEYLG